MEVAMETQLWGNFLEYVINKKSFKLACASRQ